MGTTRIQTLTKRRNRIWCETVKFNGGGQSAKTFQSTRAHKHINTQAEKQ